MTPPPATSDATTTSARIGLLGGSFDPVHNGHLEAAEQARRALQLDTVLLIPCLRQPHKPHRVLAPARHRLAMAQLAAAGRPWLQVDDLEIRRGGISYTIDTVGRLRQRFGAGPELVFIVGLDAFVTLHTWKRWTGIVGQAAMAVVLRGERAAGAGPLAKQLESYIGLCLSEAYRYDPAGRRFVHPRWKPIWPVEMEPVAVSSSLVRRRLKENKPVDDLVPPAVAAYIADKDVYR